MNEFKKDDVEKILARKEFEELLSQDLSQLSEKRILITGSEGSIGKKLNQILINSEIKVCATDIVGENKIMDVTSSNEVKTVLNEFNPDIIIHLAGAKHAPIGEHETWETLNINVVGTKNIIDNMSEDCKLILASTCKSANPEIVYGASKLIAERMVLNNGGSVARFFNVIETQGNVFEIWNSLSDDEEIQVAESCERHFISLDESVGLILFTMQAAPGRYIVNSGPLVKMGEVAERLYPNRLKKIISPRRGDRLSEKFLATSESVESYFLDTKIIKVKNIHDKTF